MKLKFKSGRTGLAALLLVGGTIYSGIAVAEVTSKSCPYSCLTLGLTRADGCSDYKRGDTCYVSTGGSTISTGASTQASSSKGGLQLCVTSTGTLSALGKCRAKKGETRLTSNNLPTIGDISLNGVPSGQTVTGAIGGQFYAPIASSWSITQQIPGTADTAFNSDSVIVASTAELTTACGSATGCINTNEQTFTSLCTGSVASPTAPAGKLCVYFNKATNATDIKAEAVNSSSKGGFNVSWSAPAIGATAVEAVFAYTAP